MWLLVNNSCSLNIPLNQLLLVASYGILQDVIVGGKRKEHCGDEKKITEN